MPNYEYRCQSCNHQYEKHEGFDAPAKQPCPNCGEEAKRMLFAPPIVFKGNGFYITDSRKNTSATFTSDTGPGGVNAPSATPSPAGTGESKPAPASAASDD